MISISFSFSIHWIFGGLGLTILICAFKALGSFNKPVEDRQAIYLLGFVFGVLTMLSMGAWLISDERNQSHIYRYLGGVVVVDTALRER